MQINPQGLIKYILGSSRKLGRKLWQSLQIFACSLAPLNFHKTGMWPILYYLRRATSTSQGTTGQWAQHQWLESYGRRFWVRISEMEIKGLNYELAIFANPLIAGGTCWSREPQNLWKFLKRETVAQIDQMWHDFFQSSIWQLSSTFRSPQFLRKPVFFFFTHLW